ncbi:uncharacterized protein LOC117302649 [Asterias rubens]|uniref:uncharacterized protein LOC117302649 n=1 Tax=Asterias rubens TaxID=7604 RepID=UPI00145575FB|nr:uncharacterized protein LOC117302649 [Asterias rubens]
MEVMAQASPNSHSSFEIPSQINLGRFNINPVTRCGKRLQMLKMLLFPLTPAICLFVVTAINFQQALMARNEMRDFNLVFQQSVGLGDIMHAIEIEQSLATLYTRYDDVSRISLNSIYAETNTAVEELPYWPEETRFVSGEQFLSFLNIQRDKSRQENTTTFELLRIYSDVKRAFLPLLTETILLTNHASLWKNLVAYSFIIRSQERTGAMSAYGTEFFLLGFLTTNNYLTFVRNEELANFYLNTCLNYVPETRDVYNNRLIARQVDPNDVKILKKEIFANELRVTWEALALRKLRLADWLGNTTAQLKVIRNVGVYIETIVKEQLVKDIGSTNDEILVAAILLCVVCFVTPVILILVSKATNSIQKFASKRTLELNAEKKRSDSLLYRMLPKQVAKQLKIGDDVSAESYELVSILFSDIVGFTEMSARSAPMQVVNFLNFLYQLFDERIETYDVYKVETIGDAYMVASGLPLRNGNRHAGEVASLALDLIEKIKDCKIPHLPTENILIRIGLHSGPCVAGVVGSKMPRFCLFGDTVNTASRMEAHSESMKIHTSAECHKLLVTLGGYLLESRGMMEIKGKGLMQTYWLSGFKRNMSPRSPPSATVSLGVPSPKSRSFQSSGSNSVSRTTVNLNTPHFTMETTRHLPTCLLYMVIMALVVSSVVNSTVETEDACQTPGIETRISNLEVALVTVNQDNTKMKKLIMATLNVVLSPEETQCEHTQHIAEVIGDLPFIFNQGHSSCALMGTAAHPAASCSQLHEACQRPSGDYFVIMRGIFTQVYCEMSESEGGWTRFGSADMGSVWNYRDESETEVTLTIISAADIKLAKDLNFNTFRVLTDVEFRLQADDSTNPSSVETRSLPWLEPETLTIGAGRDHTRLELTEDGDRMACFAGGSSRCGEQGLPRVDQPSDRLVITSLYFGPRAVSRGAYVSSAHTTTWPRNRYTWSGSYYYLLAK